VSRYHKGKTNLYFTEARDSEWQWHQLGHMQVCTSLQTDNHASTAPLSFLQAGCPSCCPANSIKALEETKVSCKSHINILCFLGLSLREHLRVLISLLVLPGTTQLPKRHFTWLDHRPAERRS